MANKRLNGIGVWFTEEIENALRGVDSANQNVAQHVNTPEMELYRRGFVDALAAVAETFGIAWRGGESHVGQAHRGHGEEGAGRRGLRARR